MSKENQVILGKEELLKRADAQVILKFCPKIKDVCRKDCIYFSGIELLSSIFLDIKNCKGCDQEHQNSCDKCLKGFDTVRYTPDSPMCALNPKHRILCGYFKEPSNLEFKTSSK